MICVLRHKESGKYVKAAIGRYVQVGHTVMWDGDKSKIRFHLTDNLLHARQIEDPDMEMVQGFKLEPVPIKLTKAKIEPAYRIIEHGE